MSTSAADITRAGLSRFQSVSSALTSTTSLLLLGAATLVFYVRARRDAISDVPVCVRDYEVLARHALARRPTRGARPR